jgi:hypothetical protein
MIVCLRTSPPSLLAASRRNVPWRKATVPLRMPFCGNVRKPRRERVCYRGLSSSTVRAAASTGSISYNGLPLVVWSRKTLPPYFLVASSYYVLGPEVPVLGRVPLSSYFGEKGGKRIRLIGRSPSAEGASSWILAVGALARGRLPLVSLRAPPPEQSLRPRHDFVGRKNPILCRVPFAGDLGRQSRKGIGDRNLLSSAAGAATRKSCSPPVGNSRSMCYSRPPFMVRPFGTFPPNAPV